MKWLMQLKSEKGLSNELPKPPKATYGSFDSGEGRHFPENAPPSPMPQPRPYMDESGDLVIPFSSDPRYHWWAGGQSIEETIKEITKGKDDS